MRNMRSVRGLMFVLILALLGGVVPEPVQAFELREGFTGVMEAHVNLRMADAIVDLVRVQTEERSVWVVAGFLVPGRDGLHYVSNGPWSSSSEVEAYLYAHVTISPYNGHNDPYLQRIEKLFQYTELLFWRIRIVDE